MKKEFKLGQVIRPLVFFVWGGGGGGGESFPPVLVRTSTIVIQIQSAWQQEERFAWDFQE